MFLMENPVRGQSIEYNDNRISLYVGQRGRCYVTGEKLQVSDMEAHHKKPKSVGGKDEYKASRTASRIGKPCVRAPHTSFHGHGV